MKVQWSTPDFSKEEYNAAISSLENFIGANGPEVKEFERELASYVGSKHAIAVCNGTAALLVSLMCMKEVFGEVKIGVPSFTFIASANSAQQIFGKENVVLLDCERETWNVGCDTLSPNIDCLMTVDTGGLSCDYKELKKRGIPIIADSAESLGSVYRNERVGTQAEMHCFSLHRSKIVSCGEGGAITTDSDELNELARSFINHGYAKNKKNYEYIHSNFGLNFRMSDVNAAIARVQLKKISRYVSHRNYIANIYRQELHNKVEFQEFDKKIYLNNYFFFGVLSKNRQSILNHLLSKDIQVKTWTAVHQQPIWRREGLPISKKLSDEIILLPIHNVIKENEIEYVLKNIKEVL